MADGEMEAEETPPDPKVSRIRWNDATRAGADRLASMAGEQGLVPTPMGGDAKTREVERSCVTRSACPNVT